MIVAPTNSCEYFIFISHFRALPVVYKSPLYLFIALSMDEPGSSQSNLHVTHATSTSNHILGLDDLLTSTFYEDRYTYFKAESCTSNGVWFKISMPALYRLVLVTQHLTVFKTDDKAELYVSVVQITQHASPTPRIRIMTYGNQFSTAESYLGPSPGALTFQDSIPYH